MAMLTIDDLPTISAGSHASWIVDPRNSYDHTARALVRTGLANGEKVFAFGPRDSAALAALAEAGAITADPAEAFLDSGPLVTAAMFAMFRQQVALALNEGHQGLRVVADMDWLLSTGATSRDALTFELLLDAVVKELGATVVCAYHQTSFDHDLLGSIGSVHPLHVGSDEPWFSLVSLSEGTWKLGGEIDLSVEDAFTAALEAISAAPRKVIDVTDLTFIDVRNLGALATASVNAQIILRGAKPGLRRLIDLAFPELAPLDDDGRSSAS